MNQWLAKLLDPFCCTIIAFGTDRETAVLDEVLATADIVASAVPDTGATTGVFSRERLALLTDTALFVNLGRGSVVDEVALADALDTGWLSGAVIDVRLGEPLLKNHRFCECPNMIMTQHSGGGTKDEIDRKIDVFATNLARHHSGNQLVGKVNFSRCY